MSKLKERYLKEVKPALKDKFKYANVMQVPVLKKVVVNMGLAEALRDKNALQDALQELSMITGQKAVATKAKKSISNFKLRDGQKIGAMVTLRGQRMYDFVDRFFNISSPRIRDFRGFKKKGDGRGSYTLGLDDYDIFPERDLDKITRRLGMNITFVTSAQNDEESTELLAQLGCPFKK